TCFVYFSALSWERRIWFFLEGFFFWEGPSQVFSSNSFALFGSFFYRGNGGSPSLGGKKKMSFFIKKNKFFQRSLIPREKFFFRRSPK
ncbi:hypothetical protein, partial [Ralstonia solanacearum]|uniref:hypothetical protein n=1 Tax=Ralstonia solanacearum TaxID=305 RepID=UPI0019D3D217